MGPMRITKGETVISPEADLILSPFRQLAGLMFARRRDLVFDLGRDKAVWMHMVFVFYPIDVVLLDSARKVVGLRARFRPFGWYRPGIVARYILELEAGAIARGGLSLGDRLELV
jgi:uncharacterized membrane protein (UPF0127 family)